LRRFSAQREQERLLCTCTHIEKAMEALRAKKATIRVSARAVQPEAEEEDESPEKLEGEAEKAGEAGEAGKEEGGE
jgi:uncharacterized protein YPO0396